MLTPINSSSELDSVYMQKALAEHHKNDVSISMFEVTKPEKRGGFLSEIVFVKVKYRICSEEQERSQELVVKLLPPENDRKVVMKDLGLYDRELAAYEHLNSSFARTVCLGDDGRSAVPSLISGASSKEAFTLIMQDMKAIGYATSVLPMGSSFAQTRAIFCSMSRIHALGVIQINRNERLGDVTAIGESDWIFGFINPNLDLMTNMFEGSPHVEIFEKMRSESVVKNMLELPKRHAFIETIIHGDLWAGNVLFDSNEKNCSVIDWQFGSLGNLVLDIVDMLFMSCEVNIIEKMDILTDLLEKYWDSFCKTVSEHGGSVSKTFKDFEKCVFDILPFGFMFMIASVDALLESKHISKERITQCIIFMQKSSSYDAIFTQ